MPFRHNFYLSRKGGKAVNSSPVSHVSFFCRDTLIYAVSANVNGLADVMDILSEVVLRPAIKSEEVL